jgi:hypothetical protein
MTEDEWVSLINCKTTAEWYTAMEALKIPRGGKYPNEINTHSRMFAALFAKLPQ